MRSPFKFLDAYTREDAQVFFGREAEIDALYQMIFKTPLLLVYGLSGTGKTSLIQCGLASRYDGPDWNPFFVRRQSNINDALRQALQHAMPDREYTTAPDAVSYLFRYYLRPVYLIFDQFEELFLLGAAEEQEAFMQDLQQLLAADLPCKIILVMREEYIGQLYNFEKTVPTLFDFRFRVEPMNAGKVKTVIQSSFSAFNIGLEPPEEERLQQMVDNLSAGKSGIQLPYLQVYLDMLYREDFSRTYPKGAPAKTGYPSLTFTRAEIEQFGRIEDVLEKFLRQQEAELQVQLREKYPDLPKEGVRSVLDAFVTEEGTKRPVTYRRDEQTARLSIDPKVAETLPDLPAGALTAILEALEQRRLLRFADDSIELAHDSLAALIDEQRTDEQRRRNEIKRRLRSNYLEHRQTGEFLSRKQLNAYEEFFSELRLDPEIEQFIADSRRQVEELEQREEERRQRELELTRQKLEAEQRAARRQRFFSIIISIVAVAAIALGVWAFYQRTQARQAEQKAVRAREDLQQQVFDNYLNQSKTDKANGRYEEAVARLREAKAYVTQDEQRRLLVDSLIEQYNSVALLITEGDSLQTTEADWPLALERYQSAYAISPDVLIANRVDQLQDKIDQQFDALVQSAEEVLEYSGSCRYALPIFRRARQLKPENEQVNRSIAACGG